MIEFSVEVNKQLYEISELITKVSYKDILNDGCSKLEFSYINDDLIIENGSIVRFKFNDESIFYGYVFKVSRNKGKEISVTAYDQLRYCKAKDTIVIKGETVTSLVKKMCNYFKLTTGILTNTTYLLPTSVQDSKTWMDIIYYGINETLVNKGKKYCLRDEFGHISLRDLDDLKLDLVLGDESFCYDFSYDKSIDDEFYNLIKIYVKGDSKTEKDNQMVISKNDASISKFGALQYFEVAQENTNVSQAKAKADMLLSLYNREVETLSLECLGDISIRAGSSFYAQISDISLNKRLIVKEVAHEFIPVHTMSLEVTI